MFEQPEVQFRDDPLNVPPQDRLFIVAKGDEGWGWQLRFYRKPFPRMPLKLRLGINAVEAWEIVEEMRKVDAKHVVMTEQAYKNTFKEIFNSPTFPHVVTNI